MVEYKNIPLKKEFAERIQRLIEQNPDLGFRSVTQFIEDASRRRLEELEKQYANKPTKPPLEHFNLNEDGVIIIDRIIQPGKERLIQIYFKPEGILCEYHNTNDCYHIRYAYTKEDIKKVLRKHYKEGWKLPDPDNPEEWWGCPDLNRGPESPSLGA